MHLLHCNVTNLKNFYCTLRRSANGAMPTKAAFFYEELRATKALPWAGLLRGLCGLRRFEVLITGFHSGSRIAVDGCILCPEHRVSVPVGIIPSVSF
jgi:hypothetical protein